MIKKTKIEICKIYSHFITYIKNLLSVNIAFYILINKNQEINNWFSHIVSFFFHKKIHFFLLASIFERTESIFPTFSYICIGNI